MPSGPGLATDGIELGWTEIPGFLYSFRRMAALSSDQRPHELLPALARNIITSGYRASRASESLVLTEYLKLVIQYLSQARELKQFAGANETIDVPSCESEETARLLRILGFRLRNTCGANALLETVNPSRAFLAIDSGFPLAELEDAYRRDVAFHRAYRSSRLPVLFGEEYWLSAARRKGKGSFVDTFLGDPALARLYVAMAGLHEPTARALREAVPAERLKDFAHVLDFFGGSFEIQDGKAVVPGGKRTESTWSELVGVPPAQGAKFFQALIEVDDGWMASYFDALSRPRQHTGILDSTETAEALLSRRARRVDQPRTGTADFPIEFRSPAADRSPVYRSRWRSAHSQVGLRTGSDCSIGIATPGSKASATKPSPRGPSLTMSSKRCSCFVDGSWKSSR